MSILVTGAAGFIGAGVCARLLDDGVAVLGIDNLNDYYDPSLKQARLQRLQARSGFRFQCLDLADRDGVARLFREARPERVIHLAAQAGVRYSIEHPFAYCDSNLTGFLTMLEGCRQAQVAHLTYASTSSVYGLNEAVPFSEQQAVDHPVSLYAATKKANEAMAHSYAQLYGLPCTGLRFFTVYGPWGRPDMAPMKFARQIFAGETIDLYNHGDMIRDFTYIDDIVEGVVRISALPAAPDPDWNGQEPGCASSSAPWRIYNIGNNQPVHLMDFVQALERACGVPVRSRKLPMQPGDVYRTQADVSALEAATGFRPQVDVQTGVERLIAWYREYYL
ncbi:MAG: NAD-dependent epimerase [Planctomycetota bacterium]